MQKIFDRNKLKLHRNRAAENLEKYDFLIELSADDIFERLKSINVAHDSILEIGARTGNLTQKVLENYLGSNIVITDISDEMTKLNPAKNKIVIDEENIKSVNFNSKFDIIVSVLNFHHINDLQKLFTDILDILAPKGIFIASLIGGRSLSALRKFLLNSEMVTGSSHRPHISPFAGAQDIYRLLQISGFKFIITDIQKIEVDYDNVLSCMHELRNMGESSCLIEGAKSLTKSLLQIAKETPFTDCVEIITLTASLKQITQKSVF